jgi:branched-chain amino acid transport system permease protein
VLPLIIGSAGNFQTVVFGALLVLMLQVAPQGLWPVLFGPPPAAVRPKLIGDARLPNRPAAAKDETLLEVSQASKRFGGLLAVNNVTFQVRAGEILGLIGPNGAGR